jgi:hypothetical protein
MATIYKPGQSVPVSGQYAAVTYTMQKTREVTCTKGEPFPPTRIGEIGYVLVDATRH